MFKRLSTKHARISAIGCGLGLLCMSAAPATQPTSVKTLPPMATAPESSSSATIAPMTYRPVLPPARASREPRMLLKDVQHPLRNRPAVDVPFAMQASAELPSVTLLQVGP